MEAVSSSSILKSAEGHEVEDLRAAAPDSVADHDNVSAISAPKGRLQIRGERDTEELFQDVKKPKADIDSSKRSK
jgi:hypothetical protein